MWRSTYLDILHEECLITADSTSCLFFIVLHYLWPWIRDKGISMPCPSWGTIFWLWSIPSWWTTSLSWDTEEIRSSVLQTKAMPPWCICLLQPHKPSGTLLCYPRIQKILLQIMQPYNEHATWMIWHKSETMQYNTTHNHVEQYLINCKFVNRRFPIYAIFYSRSVSQTIIFSFMDPKFIYV